MGKCPNAIYFESKYERERTKYLNIFIYLPTLDVPREALHPTTFPWVIRGHMSQICFFFSLTSDRNEVETEDGPNVFRLSRRID